MRDLLKFSRPFMVSFIGEGAIDVAGVFREFISMISTELQTTKLPLLIQVPNGKANVGANRGMYQPSPILNSAEGLHWFRWLGMFIAFAIRSDCVLEVDLPSLVWKRFTGEANTLDVNDLKAIDQMCVQGMNYLRKAESYGVDASNFEDVYGGTNFTTAGSDGALVELIPNGTNIDVTFENRIEYADRVEKYRLNEVNKQIEAMIAGFKQVIPLVPISLMTWRELKGLVEGTSEVDINVLKNYTVLAGYSATDETIRYMWETLEQFNSEQKQKFLKFVWGRSRLPQSHEQLKETPFWVCKLSFSTSSSTSVVDQLPKSHTCMFQLILPPYTSRESLQQKLLLAIYECEAIDDDY
jgi:E3 ubiquitin-protein ligase HECTD3